MRSRQAGITFIGWVVLLAPLAIVLFAGIKVSTIYMNHYKVAKVLDQTAKNFVGTEAVSPASVRVEIERRFVIEGVETPTPEDIVLERDGDNWVIVAEYNRETSLFGNLHLLMRFNKRAVVQ